jgi:hypothetical protein
MEAARQNDAGLVAESLKGNYDDFRQIVQQNRPQQAASRKHWLLS